MLECLANHRSPPQLSFPLPEKRVRTITHACFSLSYGVPEFIWHIWQGTRFAVFVISFCFCSNLPLVPARDREASLARMGAESDRDKPRILMAPPAPFFPLNSSLGAFFLSLVSVSAGEAALAQPSANCIEEKSLEGIGKKETLTNSNKRETGCSCTKAL